MEHFINDFCQIELYDQYAILTINENVDFTINKASILRNKLRQHYEAKDFIMISHRKFEHKVSPDIYKQGLLNNMIGLAIVSSNDKERDKATIEQPLYGKSFAFFNTLEEAKSWAKSFF
ncbi:hypothetical protein ATE84_3018 [Aquimarina sp. MAR_2010_214]|uniref:hypothetical protein n=1 Tax=Aquimarina sp. MAR_2010_214 TaxID=1250026 RepID=UPI000C712B57|nr:hypothetical protein [Aquimarina sp. MAR_2010_214]PKV50949.1 hypothetical protein ATE84_3018 [Aquimarina sp. MAR_2010_214]